VHETEAWLLSQPSIFPTALQEEIAANTQRPELVNSHEHPAKFLHRLYTAHLNRGYKKVTDGNALFGKLDPAVACSKCPHLKAMLDDMLALARNIGP